MQCNILCALVYSILYLVVIAGSLQAQFETRTWTDISGRYKVEAEFVRLVEDKVTIKKADGTEKEILIGQLSKVDREFVLSRKNMPEKPEELKLAEGEKGVAIGPPPAIAQPDDFELAWSYRAGYRPAVPTKLNPNTNGYLHVDVTSKYHVRNSRLDVNSLEDSEHRKIFIKPWTYFGSQFENDPPDDAKSLRLSGTLELDCVTKSKMVESKLIPLRQGEKFNIGKFPMRFHEVSHVHGSITIQLVSAEKLKEVLGVEYFDKNHNKISVVDRGMAGIGAIISNPKNKDRLPINFRRHTELDTDDKIASVRMEVAEETEKVTIPIDVEIPIPKR